MYVRECVCVSVYVRECVRVRACGEKPMIVV